MNFPAVVLAVTTLGLGSASVYLYTELDAARGRADAETALRLDQEARVKSLEETRARLERQLRASAGAATWDAGSDATSSPLAPPPRTAVANAGAGDPSNRQFDFGAEGRNFRNLMNTPEGRKAMLAAQKMGLRATYKDLARELNLSTDQANQLIDLLARQQAAQFDSFRQNRGDPAAMAAANSERQRQNDIELMTLLGDKYQKYENYQDTLGERAQVEQLGVQFAASNLPLADSQKKQLMAAMVEESKAAPQPEWSQDATPQENMARMREWQEAYNKRMADRASAVLNSEQLAQYKEMQSAQSMPFGGGAIALANGRSIQFGFGGRRGPGR